MTAPIEKACRVFRTPAHTHRRPPPTYLHPLGTDTDGHQPVPSPSANSTWWRAAASFCSDPYLAHMLVTRPLAGAGLGSGPTTWPSSRRPTRHQKGSTRSAPGCTCPQPTSRDTLTATRCPVGAASSPDQLPHGWLMRVPADPDSHTDEHPRRPADVLQRYARHRGGDFVLLDQNAEVLDDLPTWQR